MAVVVVVVLEPAPGEDHMSGITTSDLEARKSEEVPQKELR